MATKKDANIKTVHYMGTDYQVDQDALFSMKYQRMIAQADRDLAGMFDAMDVIFCGKFDEYAQTIPEEDGTIGKYGASMQALTAFINAVAEQLGSAKN